MTDKKRLPYVIVIMTRDTFMYVRIIFVWSLALLTYLMRCNFSRDPLMPYTSRAMCDRIVIIISPLHIDATGSSKGRNNRECSCILQEVRDWSSFSFLLSIFRFSHHRFVERNEVVTKVKKHNLAGIVRLTHSGVVLLASSFRHNPCYVTFKLTMLGEEIKMYEFKNSIQGYLCILNIF